MNVVDLYECGSAKRVAPVACKYLQSIYLTYVEYQTNKEDLQVSRLPNWSQIYNASCKVAIETEKWCISALK